MIPQTSRRDKALTLPERAGRIALTIFTNAECEHPLYTALAYDPETGEVQLTKGERDIDNGGRLIVRTCNVVKRTCNCPDATGRIARLNAALEREGFLPSLECRHPSIADAKIALGLVPGKATPAAPPAPLAPPANRFASREAFERAREMDYA